MLISQSWLTEWVAPEIGPEALAEKLTLAGLEVDSVAHAGPALDNTRIVIGQIVSVKPHANATELRICDVDVGRPGNFSIVCGAANAKTGMKTAVALCGAKLVGFSVAEREIRGVKSYGMLCSAAELGLAEVSGGILEFDQSAEPGQGVGDYLDLRDSVIQLKLTPNRGDCLGIVGVAREVSTLTNSRLNIPKIQKIRATVNKALKVTLDAPQACPRYVGRAITHIDMTAKTPDWMAERLRRCGMRSINPIVDVTNYVMYELGQPMHAFDLKKIARGIVVRRAGKGEKLALLNGSTVALDTHNLVIADREKSIALAGIMGGANSAISENTVEIYLEAAYFSSADIRGKAREFGMHTDASHRFECGVDSGLPLRAMERATRLVLQIAGGQAGPITHAVVKSALPETPNIRFSYAEISRVLGISIPVDRSTQIMQNLGMSVAATENGWMVRPPGWRFDIQAQHDLVEEIGRCYGFDKVPPRMPLVQPRTGAHLEKNLSPNDIKRTLVHRGYHEAITYSFVDATMQKQLLGKGGAIRLANPIAENMSVMRQSLWPGLMEALRTNLNRQEGRVRLFEMGNVFYRAKNALKSREIQRVAGLVCGHCFPRQWGIAGIEADFYDIKADLESLIKLTSLAGKLRFRPGSHAALHPGQCAQIHIGGQQIGLIGKLNPAQQKLYDIDKSIYLFEVDLDPLSCFVIPCFSGISKFPSMQRDIAVLADESVSVQSIMDLVRASAGGMLKKLELFDVYRDSNLGKNRKSFAFSLTFQSESSNLISSKVDQVTEKVIRELEEKLDVQLR